MRKKPLISVVIPIYNVQDYLPECLDSVINQSYKNLEIICIDDGSPDNSGKIADEYAEKDKRIKVIHRKNGGLGSARNTGIEFSTGDYIAFLDSDDFISKDFYKNLMSACDNDDIVMTTNIVHYYSKNKQAVKIKKYKNKKELILDSGVCWNKIYRREFLINNDIKFFPKTNLIEDNYFSVKVYLLAKSIKIIDNSVYYYRINPNSVTHSSLTNKDFICIDIAKGIESYKKFVPEFSKIIDKKISRELGCFYEKLSFEYKGEFKKLFKRNFPKLRMAIRKPLKWIFENIKRKILFIIFLGNITFRRMNKNGNILHSIRWF